MGVESGMPADPDLLPILQKLNCRGAVAGHRDRPRRHLAAAPRGAELGGHLRTGLEDTFYLPDGSKYGSNGAVDRGNRRLRAARGARDRKPGRSAADFREPAHLPSFRAREA